MGDMVTLGVDAPATPVACFRDFTFGQAGALGGAPFCSPCYGNISALAAACFPAALSLQGHCVVVDCSRS